MSNSIFKNLTFKLGDFVTWDSQSQASSTTKVGQVVAVVPPDSRPDPLIPPGMQCNSKAGFGMGRNHETYLVKVVGKGSKVYWPRVAHLRLYDDNPKASTKQRVLYSLAAYCDKLANDVRNPSDYTLFCAELSRELSERAKAIEKEKAIEKGRA